MRKPRGGIETAWSHWSRLMEGMQASPKDLYQAIADAIERREIPRCKLRRVLWKEGGWFSANRLYLRAERGEDLVDICGAPFGTGFFASSWLCTPPPSILQAVIALILGAVFGFFLLRSMSLSTAVQAFGVYGRLDAQMQGTLALLAIDGIFLLVVFLFGIIRPLFFPPRLTYYRYDTAQMFYSAVHNAVIEVVQESREKQGLRLLTEDETKPIMRGFGR